MAILSFAAFAGEKQKRLTCPESILCNYETGKCLYPKKYRYKEDWLLNSDSAERSFKGAREIRFHMAAMMRFKPLICVYSYDYHSIFVLSSKNYVVNQNGIGWYSQFLRPGMPVKVCDASSGVDQCAAWEITPSRQ